MEEVKIIEASAGFDGEDEIKRGIGGDAKEGFALCVGSGFAGRGSAAAGQGGDDGAQRRARMALAVDDGGLGSSRGRREERVGGGCGKTSLLLVGCGGFKIGLLKAVRWSGR